jgi:hypothetical protein
MTQEYKLRADARHGEDLVGGRYLAPGSIVQLTDEDIDHYKTQQLINDGLLLETSAPQEARIEEVSEWRSLSSTPTPEEDEEEVK